MLQNWITVEDARRNLIWVWVGTNRTGKTSCAIKRAIAWKKSRPGQKVAAYDPQGKFRVVTFINSKGQVEKLVDKVFNEWNKDWGNQLLELKDPNKKTLTEDQLKKEDFIWTDYLLILDDYHTLCEHFKTPAAFVRIIALRAFLNIDMILITHSPKFILEGVADYVTHLSIFFSGAKAEAYEKKITYHGKCFESTIVINEYVVKNGFGKYPIFPYIKINNLNGKVDYVNMEWKKIKELSCFKKLER